jgi:hypothetical protein
VSEKIMQPEHIEILHGIVDETARALFSSYGFECRPAPDPSAKNELAAVLGFSAAYLSGSLSLATDNGVATVLVEGTRGATGVEDWLGELTNQLFGRLQRRLLPHGVALSGGLPVVVEGEELTVLDQVSPKARDAPNRERVSLDRAIQVAGGTVLVRVALEFEDQFTFLAPGTVPDEGIVEDEPILF